MATLRLELFKLSSSSTLSPSSSSLSSLSSSSLAPSLNLNACDSVVSSAEPSKIRLPVPFAKHLKEVSDISSLCLSSNVKPFNKSFAGVAHRRRERSPFKVQSSLANAEAPHTDTFLNVTTEEEMLNGIEKEAELKKLPKLAGPGMKLFYFNYKKAVIKSGVKDAEALALKVMSAIFDRIMVQFENPFTFPSHHLRITEPYDYYSFGQNFARPLIDFKNSYLGNKHIFDEIEKQLAKGENVILLSNHQTEADPAVLALLLEHSHPKLSEQLTYVAGDRVVLDPFCKPFSMGRNLLCVFSKKRINDVPELAAQKMAQNRKTLKVMSSLLNEGGILIWIAPSGGRDRPDPSTQQWIPSKFDASSVEMMRRLAHDSKSPGHLYPLSLLCYDIMPPPPSVVKELGEQRIINFHGVGLSVANEIDFDTVTKGIEDRKEARELYSSFVFDEVNRHYDVLKSAVHGNLGFDAATPFLSLSQPWNEPLSIISEPNLSVPENVVANC